MTIRRGAALLILAPLRIEARALRSGAPEASVLRAGLGGRRARCAALASAEMPADAVAVAGVCGALSPDLAPGDLVVATELRRPEDEPRALPGAELLAGELRRAGLTVHCGPLLTTARPLVGAHRRAEAAATGAIAADMESAWLAPAAAGRPLAVVRAVVDTPGHELLRPLATARGGIRALRSLRAAAPVLARWAEAAAQRHVLLGSPRASCAGVERAIDTVERALELHGPPVYVRRQIVHNAHVVARLEERGAVFVDELEEVPDGALVIFSAHGVAPAVRAQARERELDVVDATCPLVAKVHSEARRFAARGYTIALIGHTDHDEIEGTLGEAPERIHVVGSEDEVADLRPEDPERVAYLTQTTLAVDETSRLVEALRARFPLLEGPPSSDICYATQNRQDAARALAAEADLVLVVGSANSSNSRRLVEVVEAAGCAAHLVDDASDVRLDWLRGARTIGITAGASAPEELVGYVVQELAGLGRLAIEERAVREEDRTFRLPVEVRG